ncbi:hypothetical protein H6761_00690 [Candidatus Nomurabacteria bacterium]|nr:hypothetical protein [Candidatus Nomurabacteria bacterium]
MQALLPFISPILLAFGFWRFLVKPDDIWLISVLSIALIILTVKILAKRHFFGFFRLWINLSIVYLAQILFLIILNVNSLRYLLTVLWIGIWYLVFLLIAKYFKNLKNINDFDYLAFTRFLYYLSFWLLASSLYYLIIFINFSLWWTLAILLLTAGFFAKEILLLSEKISSKLLWLLLFSLGQLLLALYLMPISFYLAGTIACLWLFFFLEWNLFGQKGFLKFFWLFVGAIALLLLSSLPF